MYLPESFEWIILKSGVIKTPQARKAVEDTGNQIDSEMFMSWERFFASTLISETRGSSLEYSKSRLNEAYTVGKIRKSILSVMSDIGW